MNRNPNDPLDSLSDSGVSFDDYYLDGWDGIYSDHETIDIDQAEWVGIVDPDITDHDGSSDDSGNDDGGGCGGGGCGEGG
jgi:hypothetical protein